jgi:AraC-like DNA-binding protein
MLVARGRQVLGDASLTWAVAFGQGLWVKILECRGLALDTRFALPSPDHAKPSACLVLLPRGSWEWIDHGAARQGPVAFAVSLEQLEGAEGRRSLDYRSSGEPCVSVELHFASASVLHLPTGPVPVELDEDTWAATRRVAMLAENDDEAIVAAVGELLRHLAARAIVEPEATERATMPASARIVRIWSALYPPLVRFALSTTIEDIAERAGLSKLKVELAFQFFVSTFGLVGPGMRTFTRHTRLASAVLFLSAEHASVSEVASLVGYGSATAMGRAFRDAGLPSPSAIRGELLRSRA